MREFVSFQVDGTPAPKGSYRAILRGGHAQLVPGGSDTAQKAAEQWTIRVSAASASYRLRGQLHFDCPVGFSAIFWHPEPPANADTAHVWKKGVPGDLDKVLRCTWDGISNGGLWADDSRVAMIGNVEQRWADAEHPPGALITLWALAKEELVR